ncbi:hypothetical protein LTR08_004037 [Meristemomyces frigidus]|nr:hypothetical protein LTR08_004037 [Meristemomyces frigidus]
MATVKRQKRAHAHDHDRNEGLPLWSPLPSPARETTWSAELLETRRDSVPPDAQALVTGSPRGSRIVKATTGLETTKAPAKPATSAPPSAHARARHATVLSLSPSLSPPPSRRDRARSTPPPLPPPPPSPAAIALASSLSPSASALSSLTATPEPPSPIRRLMRHLDRQPECACASWCTCAKHRFFAAGAAPRHLSEWALVGGAWRGEAGGGGGVSGERSTLREQEQEEGESQMQMQAGVRGEIRRLCDGGAEMLTALHVGVPDEWHYVPSHVLRAAVRFMHGVYWAFAEEGGEGEGERVLRRVCGTLRVWRREGGWGALWEGLDGAVNGCPELMKGFGGFLGRGFRQGMGRRRVRGRG